MFAHGPAHTAGSRYPRRPRGGVRARLRITSTGLAPVFGGRTSRLRRAPRKCYASTVMACSALSTGVPGVMLARSAVCVSDTMTSAPASPAMALAIVAAACASTASAIGVPASVGDRVSHGVLPVSPCLVCFEAARASIACTRPRRERSPAIARQDECRTPMPMKRAILDQLTAKELRAEVDNFELHVDDRRVKAQLAGVLADSRKVRLDDLLTALSRNRLKALCRVFGLDDSGRSKADLVARLAGSTAASKGDGGQAPPSGSQPRASRPHARHDARGNGDRAPPAVSRPAAKTPAPPAGTQGATTGHEADLWRMADALRGSMDAAEYKHVVLGLIFSSTSPTPSRRCTPDSRASSTRVPIRRTPTSTGPRTSSGCRRRRAGAG